MLRTIKKIYKFSIYTKKIEKYLSIRNSNKTDN